MKHHLDLSAALALAALAAAPAAQTPLTTTRIASGLSDPVYAGAPKGDDRLFIAEQDGLIKILENGSVLATPFLNISGMLSNGSEQGLLGLAFDPGFAQNGYFYTNYTRGNGDTVVSRWEVSAGDPNVADAGSEVQILVQDQSNSNHNAGCIEFGPDGYLYIAFGDGGSSNDPECDAQNLTLDFLGKIIRIDVSTLPYTVPADNPYVGDPNGLDEIWHWGLRNPWRFRFDSLTGDMYIGDVGQNAREEISFAPAGASDINFGWPFMEGNRCNSAAASCPVGTPACGAPAYEAPIYELQHQGFGGPLSIMGGPVYRGCAIPDLQGTYFFADYNDDVIRTIEYDTVNGVQNFMDRTSELAPGGGQSIVSITHIGEDGFGEIVMTDYNGGEIFQVIPASPPAGLSDCDGNGFDDACEIAKFDFKDLDFDGTLDACQSFSADIAFVSASGGTAQNLSLHAGAGEAGRLYWIVGSLSGTTPGFNFQGFNIPANFDGYTDITVNRPNQPPLVNTLGILDGSGNGSASFSLQSFVLLPSLIGMTVDHVYATVLNGQIQFISNTVQLRLDP